MSHISAVLRTRNFARHFIGQAISNVGTWMQAVAQSWLVLALGASPTMLGLVVAVQMLPYLLAGPYGGLIADRLDKRVMLIYTQAIRGVIALALGLVVVFGVAQLWEVFVLAALSGVTGAISTRARQTIVSEIVARDQVATAVTLNSVVVNGARAVGQAVAGVLIALVGTGPCFLVNAVSFIAVIISPATLDRAALRPAAPVPRRRGQIVEGFRYAARTPRIAIPLMMMVVVGTLAYEFQVSLPVMAREVFGGEAQTYGWMNSALGVGAIVGGLLVARRPTIGVRRLELSSRRLRHRVPWDRGDGLGREAAVVRGPRRPATAVRGALRPGQGRPGRRFPGIDIGRSGFRRRRAGGLSSWTMT